MTSHLPSHLTRAAVALAGSALLLSACGSDEDGSSSTAATSSPTRATTPSPSPSPTPSPSPSPAAPPAPADPQGAESPPPGGPALQLNGDDLLVTSVGAPYEQAVRAVSSVLGPPLSDPAEAAFCIGTDLDVEWAQLALGITGGEVVGWTTSDPTLEAPSGVRVGTTVATLKRVYGDRLALHPFNPDAGHSFSVGGVDFSGGLSGPDDGDRVEHLWNGACGPP